MSAALHEASRSAWLRSPYFPSGPILQGPPSTTYSQGTSVPASNSIFLSQPQTVTAQHTSIKRARSTADLDSDNAGPDGSKKKRRLRLQFVTSRLSPPFSAPATYIVDRGNSKIALWGKQNGMVGHNRVRRAAIMNCLRQRDLATSSLLAAAMSQRAQPQESWKPLPQPLRPVRQQYYLEPMASLSAGGKSYEMLRSDTSRSESSYENKTRTGSGKAHAVSAKFQWQHLPMTPSPLGLSNYDALDLEDGFSEHSSGDGAAGDVEGGLIYSDFNVLDPPDPDPSSSPQDSDGILGKPLLASTRLLSPQQPQ